MDSLKKINTNIAHIVFFDLIFYSSLVLLPIFWNRLIMKHPVLAAIGKFGNISNLGVDQIGQITSMMGSFLFLMVFSLIILVILVFLIYSLTRALIWAAICKKKFNFNLFRRFLLLNLSWLLIIIPIAALAFIIIALLGILASSTRNYALLYIVSFISIMVILIPITITFLTYYYFTKQNRIFDAIKKSLIIFKKIKLFLLPLALITIILTILSILLSLVPNNLRTTPAYMIIQVLVLLFYLALVRLYLVAVAEEIK